jgi:LmeA-like phospholipid-binding
VRRLAALGGLLFIIVVLVVAQLVLPGIAAQRLRDRLAGSGQVRSVSVSAFPAIELLWHQADSVSVSLGRYRSTQSGLTGLLNQTADVDRLRASAAELDTGLLTLRNATLRKSGAQLSGSAEITESDLRTALPVLNSVTPVSSGGGRIIFQGTATLFGVSATVTATLAPQNGALLVTPNVPLGGLATIRVFSDPRVTVEGVAASRTATGFAVTATGRIR